MSRRVFDLGARSRGGLLVLWMAASLAGAGCGGSGDGEPGAAAGGGAAGTAGAAGDGGSGGTAGSAGSGGTDDAGDASGGNEDADSAPDASQDATIDADSSTDGPSLDSATDASSDGQGDVVTDGPGGDTAEAGPGGCVVAADCDDGIACTVDACSNAACKHWAGPGAGATACPPGQVCDATSGCVSAPVCSTVAQCEAAWASDPCKVNVTCITATASCSFSVLDSDNDGHPPMACGGDDCNDAVQTAHPGGTEACNGVDDDCNGTTDDGMFCTDPLKACIAGSCQCAPQYTCPGALTCVDTQTDHYNCGVCGNKCTHFGEKCVAGQCSCPQLCDDWCSDPMTDRRNCGGCGHDCGDGVGVTCVGGACQCRAGMQVCNGLCTDTQAESGHCGSCNHACEVGQMCRQGTCQPVPGGVTTMVTVPRYGGGTYGIDRTEVTRGQWAAWLSASPAANNQPSYCEANVPFSNPEQNAACMSDTIVYQGTGWEDHPVQCVNWCDATAYCKSVGKKLCGNPTGWWQPGVPIVVEDLEWYNACSAAGANLYPYGDIYQAGTCNAYNKINPQCGYHKPCTDAAVGSFPGCQSPDPAFAGVYDLGGNVAEWLDLCETNHTCATLGGTIEGNGQCGNGDGAAWGGGMMGESAGVGFRCCSR